MVPQAFARPTPDATRVHAARSSHNCNMVPHLTKRSLPRSRRRQIHPGMGLLGSQKKASFSLTISRGSSTLTCWSSRPLISIYRFQILLATPGLPGRVPVAAMDVMDGQTLHVLYLDWRFADLHEKVEAAIAQLSATEESLRRGDWSWLEYVHGEGVYRVPATVERCVDQLLSLASELLPDFVNGWIEARLTTATAWGRTPKVLLEYHQRGETQCADLIDVAGEGAARWMSAAVQIALHLMAETGSLDTLRDLAPGFLSGHVLLIDEPEAHLHPAAVASVVRWCHRMVRHGFTVVVASHHDEFLRAAGDEVTLAHVTRDEDLVNTWVRTLPSATTTRLQELALDVGMHPASALSLHRAVLFVEGPLDEAVLDESASLRLDAAGVKIIPIHGTKNLEGLIAVELVAQLGLKIGILTDGTDVATMADRSNKRRSSEEKKVLRVLQIARERGIPGTDGIRSCGRRSPICAPGRWDP